MSNTELHHLLGRAIDGVVLHGESDRLRQLVRQLEERTEQAEDALAEERATFGSLANAHATTLIRAEQAEAKLARALAVLAPYDWPHAQVRAAAVRDALAPQQSTTTDTPC